MVVRQVATFVDHIVVPHVLELMVKLVEMVVVAIKAIIIRLLTLSSSIVVVIIMVVAIGIILMHTKTCPNIVIVDLRDLHPWLSTTHNMVVVVHVLASLANLNLLEIVIIVARLAIKLLNVMLSSVTSSSKMVVRMVVLVPIKASRYKLTIFHRLLVAHSKVYLRNLYLKCSLQAMVALIMHKWRVVTLGMLLHKVAIMPLSLSQKTEQFSVVEWHVGTS